MMAKGDRHVVARALGITPASVRERISKNDKLNALYGKIGTDQLVEPPCEAKTLLRMSSDIPVPIANHDLAVMVERTEEIIRQRQESNGLSATTLKKLRTFDKLNVAGGAIIAQSVKDTHAIYYDQLMSLDARADFILTHYLTPGTLEAPNPRYVDDAMQRMFWQRAHTEIVDQIGKGHDRMLAGAQAMVAMQKGMNNDQSGGKKAKMGWASAKTVEKAT